MTTMDAALQERLKAEMAWEFARPGPPSGFPKFPDIPIGRYTSDDFFELERQHLWTKVWVMAGRVEDVAEAGDYMTFDDLGLPILLVRGQDGVLRAFYNTCQHRGAPVVRDKKGSARNLRCQYHSWTYDITEGRLIQVPDERDFVGLCRDERGLVQIRCEVWQGWIFVNQDPEAASLHDWFGPALDQLDELAGDTLEAITFRSVVVPCNWKVTAEAFLEVYHFRHIHARGPAGGDTALDNRGATMGLLPNGCSRMITPFSVSAAKARGMADWSDWQHFTAPPFADIDSISDVVRSTSSAYSLFPNLITPLGSYGFPFLLFWPLDRRTTKLDWIHYGPKDWEGDELPAHWVKRMEGFDEIMGEDMMNMAPMQRSLESPAMRGVPINYQERRIWHFHEQIDRTIGVERVPEALRVPQLLADYVEQPPPRDE
jgi:phenylpropionate dioxygenase-like ring-hydroxylating dioxygenase large terminal subunit